MNKTKIYGNKANLCYMDIDSFIVNIKTEHVYRDTAGDVEKRLILQTIKKIKGPS